jgi:hypothetical protein
VGLGNYGKNCSIRDQNQVLLNRKWEGKNKYLESEQTNLIFNIKSD